MRILFFLFLVPLFFSCTSDEIIKSERKDYFSIYKDMFSGDTDEVERSVNHLANQKKDSKWLKKFNQPIILVTSEDKKAQATLVALGNNQEKLTWVSADGISLTFDKGVLIATRGYIQDLMGLKHERLENIFINTKDEYKKTHRYLNGGNGYDDIIFTCRLSKKPNLTLNILDYNIFADKFTESCKSSIYSYDNEYYLLPKTNIVLKSKQWISPSNESFICFNYYAFQKF